MSDPTPAAAVLIPVKSFTAAKGRLADVLDPAGRADLARSMATTVATVAAPLPVWVVCDDDAVATWARSVGANVLWKPGRGLNGAVEEGVVDLAHLDIDRVVVAHADLPHATGFSHLLDLDEVVLVPDRHDDGTNVIVAPTHSRFEFAYGPGSFRRHERTAERLGLSVTVVRDERLGWDVDRPDDLLAPDWVSTR